MVGYFACPASGWVATLAALDRQDLSLADPGLLRGRVAVAHFFTQTVLPELAARRVVVESTDNALMDAAEEDLNHQLSVGSRTMVDIVTEPH